MLRTMSILNAAGRFVSVHHFQSEDPALQGETCHILESDAVGAGELAEIAIAGHHFDAAVCLLTAAHAADATREHQRPHHQQPGLQRLDPHFQGSHDHRRRHRPAGPPRGHPGDDRPQLPQRRSAKERRKHPSDNYDNNRRVNVVDVQHRTTSLVTSLLS